MEGIGLSYGCRFRFRRLLDKLQQSEIFPPIANYDPSTMSEVVVDSDHMLLHKLQLKGHPDCIKLFPTEYQDDTLNGTLLAATYDYDANSRTRSGSIIAFNPCRFLEQCMKRGAHQITSSEEATYKVTSQYLPGVLSCSWVKAPEYYGATCITANLSIVTLKVDPEKDDCSPDYTYSLTKRHEIRLDPESDAIGLSLTHYDDSASVSSVTASDGTVYIVEDGVVSQKWKAHEMETWISTFHPTNPNIILTGADDSTIKVFDRRQQSTPTPVETITRNHAGVTALQLTKNDPNVLYTGSFDKQLMRFDMRNLKTPMSAISLDSAIWYIDFMGDNMLHVAGCYDGAFVYEVVGATASISSNNNNNEEQRGQEEDYKVVKKFTPENPLIYGVAHVPLTKGTTVQVCCDFYNKEILFWN